MKKIIFSFGLMMSLATLQAQKEVASLPVNYSSDFFSDKESIAVSNNKTKELVVLIEDNDKTILSLLDENFKQIDTVIGEKLDRKFKTFIGHSIIGDTYYIFFKNNDGKKFGYIEIDFKTGIASQIILDFKLEKEKYVEAISHNNTFYIMTSEKKTGMVNFFEFTKSKQFLKHAVDFNSVGYVKTNSNGSLSVGPYELLNSNSLGLLTKIDLNSPKAVESTSEKVKLYQVKNELLFTFDNKVDKTSVIIVNLNDFSHKDIVIDKPKLDIRPEFSSHNSLYNNGVFYQAVCSSNQLKLTARDFTTQELLKELCITDTNDTISFKNGPIIQENSSIWYKDNKRIRELEKSSKFLRKVSNGELGIVAFLNQNNIRQITIGGYVKGGGGGVGMMPMGGIPMGGIPLGGGMLTTTFNPFMGAYNSYSYTKSTRIECLFDKDFNHVEGEVENNIFDKIHEQEKRIEKEKSLAAGLKLKNVYRHNNKYYLSYLNNLDKNYNIIEIEN